MDRMNNFDWMYNQSGVVPFKRSKDGLQVLLITSRSGKRWVIPKGIVESEFSPQESAQKEAYEEAGITGKIINETRAKIPEFSSIDNPYSFWFTLESFCNYLQDVGFSSVYEILNPPRPHPHNNRKTIIALKKIPRAVFSSHDINNTKIIHREKGAVRWQE